MKIGIGICNFNRTQDVRAAVQAALDQTRPADLILVLDNASTDDSVPRLRSQFDNRIELLLNPANTGGAGGFSRLSQELLARDFDTIVLLDSDCFISPDSLQQMLALLDANPQVGICGARIMHADRPELIQECGAFLDWPTATFRLNRRDQPVNQSTTLPTSDTVDYVPACALAARREVFQTVGHFDPSFFIYFDDIEWCHRATRNGFQIAVANHAPALHKGGGKIKTNHFSTYYFWRNRIRFFLENTPAPAATRTFLLENAARAIATSETLNQPNAAAIIRAALFDALSSRFGQKDFHGLSLQLDPPSPLLISNPNAADAQTVEHIFAPSSAPDNTILQDPFGKRMLAGQSRKSAATFNAALQNITRQLDSNFS